MQLTDEEAAMRAGAFGPAVQWAIEHQIKVGDYLGAARFRAGEPGPHHGRYRVARRRRGEWLERMARLPAAERRVRVPTITDPRGTDFAAAHRLKHQPWMLDLERRAIAAFEALGVLMTDTCINYQTIMPPVRGEHVAYGDTGVVIYSNSVCGARSNFEGGPSALSAGLTGRTPRYGYHLDERRRADAAWSTSTVRRASSTTGARSAASSGGWPATIGRCRCIIGHRPRARLRRDEAFRRGARELRLGRAVSHGRHHAGGAAARRCRRGWTTLPQSRGRRGRYPSASSELRKAIEHGRSRRVLGAAAQPHRDGARSPACSTAGTRASRCLSITSPQVKPDADRMGLTGAHRGGRRHGALGHVLLPELRARNGRGERLEAAGDQLGEAHQHHRRLWL